MVANPNAPFGLRPVRHLRGGEIRLAEYAIADQYGTSLYLGDPVLCTGTGKNIGIATAGTSNKITGVFGGCEYVDVNGETRFMKGWTANTATLNAVGAKALIYDDPDILFECMVDTLVAADVRALANLNAGAGGNAATYLSSWRITEPPGAGENQVKIYGLSSDVNPGGVPNAYGANAVALVLIAQHELNAGAIQNV